MKINRTFIWEAQTLVGMSESGIIRDASKTLAKQQLHDRGYFQIQLTPVSERIYNSALPSKETIELINSMLLMLDSGVSLLETLEMLIYEKKSIVSRYIYYRLRESLHQGSSITVAFEDLNPIFSDFFL